MAKREKSAVPGENMPTDVQSRKIAKTAVFSRNNGIFDDDDDLCFPTFEFKAVGLGNAGILKGKYLRVHKRVVTGSYRRADTGSTPGAGGTRKVNWSLWVTYDTLCCGVPMEGMTCIPSREVTIIRVLKTEERSVAA